MPTKIQLRRDTASDWTSANPTLAAGEFGYESDTTKFKVGDGSTAWNSLAYNTSAGSGTTINNATNNELVTVASTTSELDAESNLTFDGSTLAVTGAATVSTTLGVTGASTLDGVTVSDNEISTNRSNDHLLLTANGTGRIEINDALDSNTLYTDWYGAASRVKLFSASLNESVDANSTDRRYGAAIANSNKLTNGSSSNSNWRPRGLIVDSAADMDGNSYTRSGHSRGPNAINCSANVKNSSSSSDATIATISGVRASADVQDYDNPTRNITVTEALGFGSTIGIEGNGSGNQTIDSAYNFYASAYKDTSGSGTATITNLFSFYAKPTAGTNNYAFYSESDTAESRIGTLERYREKINALTSSSTITVDCNEAPVHKVTLTSNTGFVISNLGTGQSVTIIIVQDSGGSNTATFGTDGSTAVKFAGGTPTLSTAGNAIDICTIFNDGTNFYGNLAKAYA